MSPYVIHFFTYDPAFSVLCVSVCLGALSNKIILNENETSGVWQVISSLMGFHTSAFLCMRTAYGLTGFVLLNSTDWYVGIIIISFWTSKLMKIILKGTNYLRSEISFTSANHASQILKPSDMHSLIGLFIARLKYNVFYSVWRSDICVVRYMCGENCEQRKVWYFLQTCTMYTDSRISVEVLRFFSYSRNERKIYIAVYYRAGY